MNLIDVQTAFQDILLAEQSSGADWIADSEIPLSPQERMGIYHNAYRVRLVEVLLDNFEHTGMYLGEEWFYKLANRYVQSHASTHQNIANYGYQFPDFLAKQLPRDLEVAELALLDWTLRRAFDGLDSQLLNNDDLQNLIGSYGAEARLVPVATVSVVTHRFNTVDIWHAIDSEKAPPAVELLEVPIDILTWRKGFSPHFRSLSIIESAAVKHLLAGDNLEQIGESLTTQFPQDDVTTEFGLMLQRWIADEVLAKAALNNSGNNQPGDR